MLELNIYIYIYTHTHIYIYIYSILTLIYLFILHYTDFVSILAVSFHMRKNPRHRAKLSTTCIKMPRFCRRQFFPNDLGGKQIHADHRKYINSEKERFCYGFYAFVVQSLYVQLILLKKFSVINGIFSKMYYQVARGRCNTRQNPWLYIWNKQDRTVFIWTVVFIYFFPCTANFFSSMVLVTNEIIKLSKSQNGQLFLLCKIVKFFWLQNMSDFHSCSIWFTGLHRKGFCLLTKCRRLILYYYSTFLNSGNNFSWLTRFERRWLRRTYINFVINISCMIRI